MQKIESGQRTHPCHNIGKESSVNARLTNPLLLWVAYIIPNTLLDTVGYSEFRSAFREVRHG